MHNDFLIDMETLITDHDSKIFDNFYSVLHI